MVADDPDCKIDLKAFHCEMLNDHELQKKDQQNYKPLPAVREVNNGFVQRDYLQIKQDVEDLISAELERMMGNPGLLALVVWKG